MGGSTKVVDTTPKTTQQMRDAVQGYIMDPKTGGIAGKAQMQAPTMAPPVTVQGAPQVNTAFNSGSDPTRARDVTAPGAYTAERVSSRDTSSVDQLGGANSAFFQNMMGQLAPAFNQRRTEGLAGAKESAGTLTGSSFANSLGKAVNRSLGEEQATLANYAVQGMGMEMNRQQGDANRSLQAGMANQSAGFNAAQLNTNSSLTAQTANQQADTNFMNAMLTRNSQGLQAQQLGSQAEQFNSGQTASQNTLQAQLDAQRNALGYQGQLSTNQTNANNFMQLLGQQSSLGVGPTTVQQKPGLGQTLTGIAGAGLGAFLGGPMGASIGGSLGSGLGSAIF